MTEIGARGLDACLTRPSRSPSTTARASSSPSTSTSATRGTRPARAPRNRADCPRASCSTRYGGSAWSCRSSGMDVVEVSPALRPRRDHRVPGQPGRARGAVRDGGPQEGAHPRPGGAAARRPLTSPRLPGDAGNLVPPMACDPWEASVLHGQPRSAPHRRSTSRATRRSTSRGVRRAPRGVRPHYPPLRAPAAPPTAYAREAPPAATPANREPNNRGHPANRPAYPARPARPTNRTAARPPRKPDPERQWSTAAQYAATSASDIVATYPSSGQNVASCSPPPASPVPTNIISPRVCAQ